MAVARGGGGLWRPWRTRLETAKEVLAAQKKAPTKEAAVEAVSIAAETARIEAEKAAEEEAERLAAVEAGGLMHGRTFRRSVELMKLLPTGCARQACGTGRKHVYVFGTPPRDTRGCVGNNILVYPNWQAAWLASGEAMPTEAQVVQAPSTGRAHRKRERDEAHRKREREEAAEAAAQLSAAAQLFPPAQGAAQPVIFSIEDMMDALDDPAGLMQR